MHTTYHGTRTTALPNTTTRGSSALPATSCANEMVERAEPGGRGRAQPQAAAPTEIGKPERVRGDPEQPDVEDRPAETERTGEVVAVPERVELAQPEDCPDDAEEDEGARESPHA